LSFAATTKPCPANAATDAFVNFVDIGWRFMAIVDAA